ncbi:MAG: thiamine pyrophosphate-dependent enzyme [Hyphomicrobiales bacterium]
MDTRKLLLGNEAIARGLIENGCRMATSYPGTPASEILAATADFQTEGKPGMHVQWAVNEKIAFEIAYAGCMAGLRTAVSMKQVGLNVASDPFMSAAYMGVKGGFIVISADDPGPHSSQTEQDSRMLAMMAKVPVLDPASPAEAKEMVATAYALSEKFKTPVMLRPTTRVCHSRQDIALGLPAADSVEVKFDKDPARWAATPRFRRKLHLELEGKLTGIAAHGPTAPVRLNPRTRSRKAVVASGVAAAHTREILPELGAWSKVAFYQVRQPFPLHAAFVEHLLDAYTDILVLEETGGVIEMQLADRRRVKGKQSGYVPRVGELTPERVQTLLASFAGVRTAVVGVEEAPGRRPTLCAGCPHRASFFAIKKAAPRGIYTSDIGCYTLGMNLGAVDTVLCMGAAITQAAGFYHAFKNARKRPDIVATIGDSTFFHSGVPALIDAVVQRVKFTLVILDNRTTAMTGNQPTPASGFGASGEPLDTVDLESLVRGCGVKFLREGDPYQLRDFIALMKAAVAYGRERGPAVVISRRPCILHRARTGVGGDVFAVEISDRCDGCGYCLKNFECPALTHLVEDRGRKRTSIDLLQCAGCGVCLQVCPKGAFRVKP